MKTLLEQGMPDSRFGPDPVLMKKRGMPVEDSRRIKDFKDKIEDGAYMDHAINRIAMELMHFLVK